MILTVKFASELGRCCILVLVLGVSVWVCRHAHANHRGSAYVIGGAQIVSRLPGIKSLLFQFLTFTFSVLHINGY